ncbi:MAG: TIGR04282 family arsenosugar biosynthesis glycosyltransferase [Chromatiales bacterium]|jgi:rSAM/selenodomain-associated transferase 1|nr:TIGR04282 family arsenosugar biosynthesis glycosyltransferase [Chromatiales bacterium]
MSDLPHKPPVLVIFCRRPAPGIGKQRLAAEIGNTRAAEISALLLNTALEDAARWPGPVVLSPSETEDTGWAATLLDRPVRVIPQPAGNLGERLQAVDQLVRDHHQGPVVFIGSDAPVLSEENYEAARSALLHHDVVLAPALDGGVTLMAARHAWPALADLPWSSDRLCTALAERCTTQGLRVTSLASSYDVDVATDLQRLCTDLRTDQRPARRILYRTLCSLGYSPA